MRYTYDNSTNNVRNPLQPPQRVTYGPQSSDEMAELWLQLLPRTTNDAAILTAAYKAKMMRVFMAQDESLLRINPADAKTQTHLALLLLGQRRAAEAEDHLRTACRLSPLDDAPHYTLGLLFRAANQLDSARAEFETALRLNPKNAKAQGNLGVIAAAQGQLSAAESYFRAALQSNPDDETARRSLDELLQAKAARGQRR